MKVKEYDNLEYYKNYLKSKKRLTEKEEWLKDAFRTSKIGSIIVGILTPFLIICTAFDRDWETLFTF